MSRARKRTAGGTSPGPKKWNSRYGLLPPEEGALEPEEGLPALPLSATLQHDPMGTSASLRSLQASPDFKAHLKSRRLTPLQVSNVERRLQLYRELRNLDPASFRKIWQRDPVDYVTLPCPLLLLALEYLGNTVLTVLGLLLLCSTTSQAVQYITAALLLNNAALWLAGSSVVGRYWDLWYEDTRWGSRAPMGRVMLCNLVEVAYCGLSLGLGGVVSLALRCQGDRGQGLGERLANIRLVKEVRRPVDVNEASPDFC